MRVVILAGGRGTRLAEETDIKPKPMIDIGGRPIIWHIMKHYQACGFDDFLIAAGYKADVVKRFFLDEAQLSGDIVIDNRAGHVTQVFEASDPWRVRVINTGLDTNTGGRILRLRPLLEDFGTFMVTYGDGVSNVDVQALLAFHKRMGKVGTITAVRPPARYGGLKFDGDDVAGFIEKPQIGEGWINGGFAVFESEIFSYLEEAGDAGGLEVALLERLAREKKLAAYKHEGFWQCMDTLREVNLVRSMWESRTAPWKTWVDANARSMRVA
jgi:glucose-1-phosphate cytidylyltransferase